MRGEPVLSARGDSLQASIKILVLLTALLMLGGNAAAFVSRAQLPLAPTATNLTYGGGAVLSAPKVYLTFWSWNVPNADPDAAAPYVTSFFQGIGGSGWANIQTQYYYGPTHTQFITNPTNQYGGSWSDTSDALPPVNTEFAGYAQAEAQAAVAHFGYDPNGVYFVLLPHGFDADFSGQYCAYHSNAQDPQGRDFAYAVLPYVTDFPTVNNSLVTAGCGVNFIPNSHHPRLDAFSMTGGHEYAEAVTDKDPNTGWFDAATSKENGDKCQFVYSGPGRYQEITLSTGIFGVQGLWSNAVSGCVATYP
jgi:serine protease